MGHLLALALLALDCLVRAWRIQLATWTAGARLSFSDALRPNLYGEAASQLTPNRLGGEAAPVLRVTEGGVRPGARRVAIGGRGACGGAGVLAALAGPVVCYVAHPREAGR